MSATEVAAALGRIYKRGPLTWPRLLQGDPGREFMGAFSQLLAKHNVQVRCGAADNHRQQGIVERSNRTLAERLFKHQKCLGDAACCTWVFRKIYQMGDSFTCCRCSLEW